ncbi:hypothetical protein [Flavobacterium flevense]|nr:hypothetical protein [Flavobacterium flevense]
MKQLLLLLLIVTLNNTVLGQGLTRHGQNSSVPERLLNSSGAIGKDNLVSKNGEKAASLVLYQNYQGGKIFYFLKPGDPGYEEGETHGLIAALNVVKETTNNNPVWSTNENLTTGTTAEGVGAGKNNTTTLIASDVNARAAILVSNYSVTSDGIVYDDWYLPSLEEALIFVSDYRKMYSANITFGIWTSTEISSSQANYIDTGSKTSGSFMKNRNFASTVPIRQF